MDVLFYLPYNRIAFLALLEEMVVRRPYIVAGPCSVESREQLNAVVSALSSMPQVSMIRCGVWKPRTRPGGFEGLGQKALEWIKELKAANPSLRFCCEVGRPEHAALILKYGLDAVWIGARTTANPFMVQELTEALRGSKVGIMVKNPPSPDVSLWVGALERCRQVGLTDIMAIHRGFDIYKNDGYRNNPLWEMPIELRRHTPETPILCDPSHIAGRREPIALLAQTAMDLGFEGLMVEVHPHPQQALTDADQQITPDQLAHILESLILRQTDSSVADEELRLLREQIDHIDQQALQLLSARFEVAKQIARVKSQGNLAVYQPKRWESLLRRRLQTAQELGMSSDFTKALFEKIHAESVRIQESELHPEEKDKRN